MSQEAVWRVSLEPVGGDGPLIKRSYSTEEKARVSMEAVAEKAETLSLPGPCRLKMSVLRDTEWTDTEIWLVSP